MQVPNPISAMAAATPLLSVNYHDEPARTWVDLYSPDEWHGNVLMQFCSVGFRHLQPAGSPTRPTIVDAYVRRLRQGAPIAPPVAVPAAQGLYLHDGNHRYHALGEFFGNFADTQSVRVALVMPRPGFEFAWVWYDGFGTYELRPVQETRDSFPSTAGSSMTASA